jgi:hypothetical protein
VPNYLVAQCRVGHGRVQRQVPMRSHETRVKGGSNRDSLKVAKCLVFSLASRGDGLTTFPSSVTTYLLTWTMTWTRTSTSGACPARLRARPGRRLQKNGKKYGCPTPTRSRRKGSPNVPIHFPAKPHALRRCCAKSRQCQAGSLTGAVHLSKANAGVLR